MSSPHHIRGVYPFGILSAGSALSLKGPCPKTPFALSREFTLERSEGKGRSWFPFAEFTLERSEGLRAGYQLTTNGDWSRSTLLRQSPGGLRKAELTRTIHSLDERLYCGRNIAASGYEVRIEAGSASAGQLRASGIYTVEQDFTHHPILHLCVAEQNVAKLMRRISKHNRPLTAQYAVAH